MCIRDRPGPVLGDEPAASGHRGYDGGQGRVHYGDVYGAGAGFWAAFAQAGPANRLVQRGAGSGRAVLFEYSSRLFPGQGRFLYDALRNRLRSAYPAAGSFHPLCGQRGPLLRAVCRDGGDLGGAGAVHRAELLEQHLGVYLANPLCGHFLQRRGLYAADRGDQGVQSGGGLATAESGVCFRGARCV